MRVLYVHAGNMFGGAERVLETLAAERQRCPALEPHFALCFDGRLAAELRACGAPLEILGGVRITRPHLVVRVRRRLSALLECHPPDVVSTQSAWSHAIFAPVVRRARLPLVMMLHDLPHGRTVLEKLAARWPPDLFVCNSLFTERAARARFPSVATEVVRCPLPVDAQSVNRPEVRKRMGVQEETVVVINVARMEPLKGQRVLVESLGRLRTSVPWVCWIVGGGQRPFELEYERSLRQAVDASGLGQRVSFLGQQQNVTELLAAADIYCQPNEGTETFGLAIVEALQAGLPVIATKVGGPEEIVTNACGRIVPPADAKALAGALDMMIGDETTRRRLASAGPERARTLCEVSARMDELRRALERVLLRAAA